MAAAPILPFGRATVLRSSPGETGASLTNRPERIAFLSNTVCASYKSGVPADQMRWG